MKKFFSQISHMLFFIVGILTASAAFAGAPNWLGTIIGGIVGVSSLLISKWFYKNN